MKRIIVLIICIILSFKANAQNTIEKNISVFVDIDGIELYTSPTKEELNDHFGTPISEAYIEADMYNYYEIIYDGLVLHLDEKGKLFSFYLNSSKYPVMTLYAFGKYVKVGDKWDKFLSMGYPIYSIRENYAEGYVRYNVVIWYKSYTFDHVTSFFVTNGIITAISSWPYES